MREVTKIPRKSNPYIVIGVIILFAILLLIDRFYWAQISQWREDEATNIWLGYTAGISNMPVGLISSAEIPNPNGMILLGFFLSFLPNLLSISFFLGVLQISVFLFVGWKSFSGNWQFLLLATVPPLSSAILRSISVEFWNQYTITLINVFFIFWALRYLEEPSLWNLPPITALILLAPSLYLAGIVNAMVMAILTIGIIIYKRPKMNNFMAVLIGVLLLISLSIFLTWSPYFQNVNLTQITGYNQTRLGIVDKFQIAWEALFGLPIYAAFQWVDNSTFESAFKNADPRILSLSTLFLLRLTGRIYFLQAIFAFTSFIYLIFVAFLKGVTTKTFDLEINHSAAKLVIVCAVFVSLSYTFSAWLGGPSWIKGERPDQTIQYLPMFLFLIFLLPFVFTTDGRVKKIITGISYVSVVIFAALNLSCGFMIIQDHLQYRGNVLTKADVPLIDKMLVVDFLANDWSEYSNSSIIPVDYDLGGGIWDWVPEFGKLLTPWYPAPMTTGRSFDYELLRQYGLTNYQEGVQLRTFGAGRYLVTYAFEDPPQVEGGHVTNYVFGRLRVTTVER